ncbi:unnamed protein product [marine sediment metagenome]|uniref:Uncharacterized protein n=1 Tax=marine sediment metagenome TaxID=412755 RepID=X0WN25_9ZZZZ
MGAGLIGYAGGKYEPSGPLVDMFNEDSITLDLEGNFDIVLNHYPADRKPSGTYKARRIPLIFRLKIIKPREWNYIENGKTKEEKKGEKESAENSAETPTERQ